MERESHREPGAGRVWTWGLPAVLLLALLVRLIAATTVDEIYGPDHIRYHQGAIDILAGRGFRSTEAGPLYAAFLALVYGLFGVGNVAAVQIAQALLWTGGVALTASIGRRLFDPITGLVAAAFAAVYPPFVKWPTMEGSVFYGTENLFLVLLLLWVWLLVRRRARRWPDTLLAGGALGLAVLTRPTPLLVPVALALWWVVMRPREIVPRVRDAALLALGMALVVLPWTVRNHREYGGIVIVAPTSGLPAFGGNNPYSGGNWVESSYTPELHWLREIEDPLERDEAYRAAVVAYWKSRTPAELLRLAGRKLFIFWTDFGPRYNFAYALMVPLAWLGLWLWRRDPRVAVLHVWTLYTMLSCVVIYANERMRMPVEPFLILLAAAVAVRVLRSVPRRWHAILLGAGWIGLHVGLWLAWGRLEEWLHVV